MMNRLFQSACIALVAVAFIAAPAQAQNSEFSVEVRSGITFPMGDLDDMGAESGFLLGGDLIWSVFPRMGLYGGYAWHKFNVDGSGDDITASGPRFGVKLIFVESGRALPWIRGGLSYSGTDGLGADLDSELGLEFGAGFDFELTPRFSVVPAVRYKTFSQETTTGEVDLSYVTLDLGAHIHF